MTAAERKLEENVSALRALALRGDELALDVLLVLERQMEGRRIYAEFEKRMLKPAGSAPETRQ